MRFTDANYYKYLQVYEQAEQEVIEAAYKRLARKYHPDLNPSKEAEEKMKLINQAYDVLSDKLKRKEYDLWLAGMRGRKSSGEAYARKEAEQRKENIDINMDDLFASARMRYKRWKECQENDFREEKVRSRKRQRQRKLKTTIIIVILAAIGGYALFASNIGGTKDYILNAIHKNPVSQDTDKKESESSGQIVEAGGNESQEIATKVLYKVSTEGSMLNVRKEPQADGELVQKLANGIVCEATGNTNEEGWLEIIIPDTDQTGWVNAKYLTLQEEENTDVSENPEVSEMPSTQTMSGRVTLTLQSRSAEDGTIVIRLMNNTDKSVSTFGLPTLVVSGESIELDPFSNMSVANVDVASGSYSDITYHIDSRAFSEESEMSGELWCMDPSEQDRTYRLKIF